MKKILVLTGSPHPNGASSRLADEFVKGAKEAGNDVFRFDAGLQPLGELHFLQLDASERTIADNDIVSREVLPKLIGADVVVFVSSLYYFGMNAQLKAVIDRFYSINHELKDDKQSAVIVAGYGVGDDLKPMKDHFNIIQKYMRWQNIGTIVAEDSWNAAKLAKHLQEAYALGKSISA